MTQEFSSRHFAPIYNLKKYEGTMRFASSEAGIEYFRMMALPAGRGHPACTPGRRGERGEADYVCARGTSGTVRREVEAAGAVPGSSGSAGRRDISVGRMQMAVSTQGRWWRSYKCPSLRAESVRHTDIEQSRTATSDGFAKCGTDILRIRNAACRYAHRLRERNEIDRWFVDVHADELAQMNLSWSN